MESPQTKSKEHATACTIEPTSQSLPKHTISISILLTKFLWFSGTRKFCVLDHASHFAQPCHEQRAVHSIEPVHVTDECISRNDLTSSSQWVLLMAWAWGSGCGLFSTPFLHALGRISHRWAGISTFPAPFLGLSLVLLLKEYRSSA